MFYIIHLFMFFLFIWISIFFHELGHMFMGILVGFHFNSMYVPFMKISKEKKSLKIKGILDFSLLCGYTLCEDTNDSIEQNKWACFFIGGPLFSVIFGIIMILISSRLNHGEYYFILGVVSLLIGTSTIIPCTYGGIILTDGYRFYRNICRSQHELYLIKLAKYSQGSLKLSMQDMKKIKKCLLNSKIELENEIGYQEFIKFLITEKEIQLAKDNLEIYIKHDSKKLSRFKEEGIKTIITLMEVNHE